MDRWLQHWLSEFEVGVATCVLQNYTVKAHGVWSPDDFLVAAQSLILDFRPLDHGAERCAISECSPRTWVTLVAGIG